MSVIRNYLSVFWIILGIVYFGANVIYTMWRYREEGGLTIKQIGIGVLASVPILMGAMLLVWGLPTVMPEKFRVGGDRIDKLEKWPALTKRRVFSLESRRCGCQREH